VQRGISLPSLIPRFVLKSAGTIADQFHVNVDYDAGREFDASNVVSLYYEGKPGSHLRRVDVGNISFAPPSSRFLTSSLPSGNYGAQAIAQFGRLQFKAIFAQQTGNIVQSHRYLVDPSLGRSPSATSKIGRSSRGASLHAGSGAVPRISKY
jgi:cell surface protein SprA